MKKLMSTRWLVGAPLAGMLVLAGGCAQAEGDADTEAAIRQGPVPVARTINVEVVHVTATPFTDYIRITGQAEAYRDVTISAEETGVIVEYLVEKGQRVSKGQVIAKMDTRVMDAQVAEARGNASLAGEQFERQRRLWEDEGIGSEISFLEARYRGEIANSRLGTLASRLEKMTIRSPIDGVFDERFIEAGEIAMMGARVVRVLSTGRLKITGGVPERFALSVRPGADALISFDIMPERQYEGRIAFVGSSVEQLSRTFPIEIVMQNPGGVIKPRMVANVQLVRDALQNVVVVPQQVVRRSEAGYHVFVAVERNGEIFAQAQPVRLGSSYGSEVVVEEGLEVGDALITLGSRLVDDGSRIRIVNTVAAGVSSPEGADAES